MQSDNPRIKETSFRVRFAETDLMGIVHHANYIIYFEMGRVDFTRQTGAPYSELENLGFSLAVSDVHVRYIAPARFDQEITVRTWLTDARSRSVGFGYEIVDTGSCQLLVTGEVKLICVDHDGQVRRIPQRWLDVMQPLVVNKVMSDG